MQLTDVQRERLSAVLEDAIDKNEDHLDWLKEHPGEPDQRQQIRDTKRVIEVDHTILALLT